MSRSGLGRETPGQELAAIESWFSLASYAVGRFYGPASPLRRDIGGMADNAAEQLRKIVAQARGLLEDVVKHVEATGFSIAVGFPWGIPLAVTFDVT